MNIIKFENIIRFNNLGSKNKILGCKSKRYLNITNN